MRLEGLAVMALTSRSFVEAIRPRSVASGPPYPIPSASNSSSPALTAASSSSPQILENYPPSAEISTSTSSSAAISTSTSSSAAISTSYSSSAEISASYSSSAEISTSHSSAVPVPTSYSSSTGVWTSYSSPAGVSTGFSSSAGVSTIYSSLPIVPTGYSSSSLRPIGNSSSSAPPIKPTGYSSAPLKPTGNSTSLSPPGKCSGETLNVLRASLDWWYTRTLYNVVSTISIQYNRQDSPTGWTILPATTPFDLSSAMASPTCTSTLTYNTVWNMSLWDISCTPAPTPVAASTTIITQTAYKQVNATSGVGRIPDVVKTPPPATITIPSSAGTYAEGTPFVYFSAYEIMTKSQTTYGNGSIGCAQATHTYNMESPFSFEYTDGDVNGTKEVGAGVTGDVAPAFLKVVGESKAVAGSWVAAPTVAVIVQDIYAAEAVLAEAASLRTTQTILQTPEPTLPSGFTTGPADTAFPSIGFTGHVESTAASLDAPTLVNTGPGKTTKPGNGGPTIPTGERTTKPNGEQHPTPTGEGPTDTTGGQPTKPTGNQPTHEGGPTTHEGGATTHEGGTITHEGEATTHGGGTATHGGGTTTHQGEITTHQEGTTTHQRETTTQGNGPERTETKGDVNHLISAVLSAATPTNALQVLQQAQATATHDNPTAVAILHGVSPSQFPGGSNNRKNHVSTASDGTPIVVVGGTTFTANSKTQFDVGTATLTPGGTVVVSGTTISLASSLTAVVVNGHTHVASQPVITPAPVLTIGGMTYSPTNGPTYRIGSQSLTPGGVITVHGTTISLESSGSSVVINGLTQDLTASPASITAPPVLTIGGEKFTAINNGYTYVINGETLTPGEMETVTIGSKTYIISLAHGATVLVIETEGPNGDVTATTVETLYSGSGARPTITDTVGVLGATTGSRPSAAAPSQSVDASLQGGAALFSIQFSAICVSIATFILAISL